MTTAELILTSGLIGLLLTIPIICNKLNIEPEDAAGFVALPLIALSIIVPLIYGFVYLFRWLF